MINDIKENQFYKKLTEQFCRSKYQVNTLNESDSEIIILENYPNEFIAITIDSIVEEIETGLYDDPYLIGWMTVMANLSDLAAVGAMPLGLVISEIFQTNTSEEFILKLQQGIADAAEKCGTFILGGDTNFGKELSLTGCALGKLNDKYLTRIGTKTNDLIYVTGYLGKGNAYATLKLFSSAQLNFNYLPSAKINEAQIIKEFASACMDTSDGMISTIDQLMRLNNLGFEIDKNPNEIIDKDSQEVAETLNIPLFLLLAGIHGEFELIFTIPQNLENEFLSKAKEINWQPLKLGKVISLPSLKMKLNNRFVNIDGTRIRNLFEKTTGDSKSYLNALLSYFKELTSI